MSGTVVFEDAKLQAVELIAETVTLNNFSVSTATTFQQTTNASNVTTNTLRFTNPTTAFVTTGNVEVGTANLFVDTTTGRVGVRTGSPEATFSVLGNNAISGSPANAIASFRAASSAGVNDAGVVIGSVNGNSPYISDVSSASLGLGFYTQNVNRLQIDSSGRVGIGTTSPNMQLDCYVGATAYAGIQVRSSSGAFGRLIANPSDAGHNAIVKADDVGIVFQADNDPNSDATGKGFYIAPWAATGPSGIRINENGNVGIGTPSPIAKLHVASHGPTYTGISGNDRFRIEERAANGNSYGLQMGIDWSSGNSSIQNYFQYANGTYTHSYNLLLNPHGGNVGVRVETPQGNLHVSDGNTTTYTGPTHTPPLYVTGNVGGEGTGSAFRHFNQTQGVGIGYNSIYATGSSANQDLNIISRGTASTYVKNYAVYSDDRLKTNEEYITNATDTLMKLKPQVYDKHEEINVILDNPIREAGLMAQDIYYDAPELRYLVSVRNKGIDAGPVNIPQERPFIDDDPTNDPDYSEWGTASAGVAYIQLIPYLIKSNQELKLKNDALEARIAALENA